MTVGRAFAATMIAAACQIGTCAAAHYDIDSSQTKSSYETKYLGIFTARGTFERVTGTLHYDPSQPLPNRPAMVRVLIDATSLKPITLDSEAKRAMLRGPEFFNVEKYPHIEFVSTQFRFVEDKLVAIDGTLTLLGQTKPVSLAVRRSGCRPATIMPASPARCEASADVEVRRSEFGMKGWSGTVSDTVKIAVDLVAVARDAADTADDKNDKGGEKLAPPAPAEPGTPPAKK